MAASVTRAVLMEASVAQIGVIERGGSADEYNREISKWHKVKQEGVWKPPCAS